MTAGPRPCHPEWDRVLAHLPRRQPWTLHPTGDTMSSGQQPPRRVTNVGSLLLTPQENESLFSFLGKKCVVSGRDPRRHPQRPVAGSGWGGLESRREKGAGAAGVPLRARPPDSRGPGAALALLPECRPAGPGAASSSCWRTRECHLCRPAQKFKSGSAPLLQVQTLL